jgi:hypothetical protein
MPMAMKMAGLMAFFQKGRFIAELLALAMAPPAFGSSSDKSKFYMTM